MKRRNAKRLVALLACLPLLCGVIFFTAKQESADAAESYTIDTYAPMQVFDGWGTSLIWWANNVGKYDWEAGSGDTTVREEIMELIYGKDGLEYNIARFNVGGGDNPNHTHVTRPQYMEGYSTLSAAYVPEYFGDNMAPEVADWANYKNDWKMSDVSYNWNADAAQRWCMEWIYQNADKLDTRDELITEFFSNSPPWYMTQTACSSGNGANSNLLAGREDEFAEYFVEVLLYLTQHGYKFDYVNPFNESTSDWWGARSIKQEGCKFTNQERADILYYVVQELDKHPELDHIKIAFDDSTGADKAWAAIQALENSNRFEAIKSRIGKLNYHLYEGSANSEKLIAEDANNRGWKNWMSEMGYNSAKTATSSTLQTGYLHTEKIRETLYNGANAYVLWQVIEELSSQLNNPDYGYGPVKVSYYSVDDVTELANYGYTLGSYHVSKQYYMLGQYSKYIRPGYRILPTSDKNGVAAISKDGKKVVLVHTNDNVTGDDLSFTLNGHYIKNAQVIVTDENQNWAKSSLAASGNKFSYTVNPYSVTTFVFDVEQYAEKPEDPPTPNKTTVSIKNGGVYTKLDAGVALPNITAINADTYQNNRFYLTNGWAGFDGDSQWVQGNANGSVGAFIKFTNTVEADFVFKCKATNANDAGKLKFELYEGTTLDESQSKADLKAVSEETGSFQVIWSAKGLDKTKKYAVRIVVTDNQWTNLSRVDLYDAARIEPEPAPAYEAPQITSATVKGGNLYLSITDDTVDDASANTYEIYWREAGSTADAQHASKTMAQLGSAVVTGLEGNAYDIWVTDAAGEKYSETVTVRNVAVDSQLIYYVNAGAANVGNYSIYERAAVNNTYKDQAYGADPITGKMWGLFSVGNEKYTSGKAGSIYQALGDVVSSTGSADGKIVYKFQVETGTYDIMLGVICSWSARAVDVVVNGTPQGTYTINDDENFISITGIADEDGFLVVEVNETADAGQYDNAMIGTIMIAKNGDTAKAFATAAEVRDVTSTAAKDVPGNAKHYRFGGLTTGYVDVINVTTAYVYGVNGVGTPKTSGVTFDKITITNTSPNAEAAKITGVVEGLYFSTPLTLTTTAATIYYYVDCGSDGSNNAAPGSLQNGVADQASSNGSWGYTGDHTSGWQNEGFLNSVHYDVKDNFYYTFTGLNAQEQVDIEVCGKDPNNWGGRSYDVYFGTSNSEYNASGNVKIGTVVIPGSGNGKFRASVKIPAETCYMFFHRTVGGDPFLSYITIATPADETPAAPTLNKTEARRNDTVKVSGLTEGDLLIIAANDGSRVSEIPVTSATMDVNLSSLPIDEETQALMFSVRHDGSLEEGTQTMLALPSVLVSGVVEEWTSKMVLHFSPSMGVTLQKLVVEAPSGKKQDVTKKEYFTYVVRENGVHRIHLTTKANETYTQEIDVEVIDVITIGVAYNTAFTDQSVNVTVSLSYKDEAFKKFYVNDEEQSLTPAKTYSFTADQNADYVIKATSAGGNEYVYNLNITNIDKENALFTMTPDYTVADGFTASLVSNNISGGTFTVTKGGASYGGLNGLHLVEAGEYTVAYESGTGKQKSFTVKLGYGAGSLGTLDGKLLSGLGAAKVYQLGTGTAMTVSDGNCTLTAGYRYMIVLQDGDDYEVQIITVEADPATQPAVVIPAAKKGCGSAAGAALPIAAIVLLLAGAVVALVKKGGERA